MEGVVVQILEVAHLVLIWSLFKESIAMEVK